MNEEKVVYWMEYQTGQSLWIRGVECKPFESDVYQCMYLPSGGLRLMELEELLEEFPNAERVSGFEEADKMRMEYKK